MVTHEFQAAVVGFQDSHHKSSIVHQLVVNFLEIRFIELDLPNYKLFLCPLTKELSVDVNVAVNVKTLKTLLSNVFVMLTFDQRAVMKINLLELTKRLGIFLKI